MIYLHKLKYRYGLLCDEHTDRSNPSKLEFLAEEVFDFIIYDREKAELFGRKAVEVCQAINTGKTFEYSENEENYTWFLIMCNMPFFSNNINWCTSLCKCFWSIDEPFVRDYYPEIGSTYEWKKFIGAIIMFANEELN